MARSAKSISAGGAAIALFLDDKSFVQQLAGTRQTMNRFGRGLGRMAIGATAGIAGFGGLSFAIGNFIEKAADAERIMIKLNQVFGDGVDQVNDYSKALAQATGQGVLNISQMQSTFGGFFRGMEFGVEETQRLSRTLTSLALDFAATQPGVNDIEAQRRFISGLEGEKEALDRYGINLSQTSLQQELYAQGVDKLVRNATEHEKVLARISLIQKAMEKQGALGSAAKNSNKLANAINGIRGAFEDLSAAIGTALVKNLSDIFGRVRDLVRIGANWVIANQDAIASLALLSAKIAAMIAAFIAVKSVGMAVIGIYLSWVPTFLSIGAAIGALTIKIRNFIAVAKLVGVVAAAAASPLTIWAVALAAVGAAIGFLALKGKKKFGELSDSYFEAMSKMAKEKAIAERMLELQRIADGINLGNAATEIKKVEKAIFDTEKKVSEASVAYNRTKEELAELVNEYDRLKAETGPGTEQDTLSPRRIAQLEELVATKKKIEAKTKENSLDKARYDQLRKESKENIKILNTTKKRLAAEEQAGIVAREERYNQLLTEQARKMEVMLGIITEREARIEELMEGEKGLTHEEASRIALMEEVNNQLAEQQKKTQKIKDIMQSVFTGIAEGASLGTQQFFQFRNQGQGNLIDLGKQQVDLLNQINAKTAPLGIGAI